MRASTSLTELFCSLQIKIPRIIKKATRVQGGGGGGGGGAGGGGGQVGGEGGQVGGEGGGLLFFSGGRGVLYKAYCYGNL